MTRPAAARCSKCGKPLRKGDAVMQELWCNVGGVVDGKRTLRPWLGIVLHSGCLPEWMRERKAAHASRRQGGEG